MGRRTVHGMPTEQCPQPTRLGSTRRQGRCRYSHLVGSARRCWHGAPRTCHQLLAAASHPPGARHATTTAASAAASTLLDRGHGASHQASSSARVRRCRLLQCSREVGRGVHQETWVQQQAVRGGSWRWCQNAPAAGCRCPGGAAATRDAAAASPYCQAGSATMGRRQRIERSPAGGVHCRLIALHGRLTDCERGL